MKKVLLFLLCIITLHCPHAIAHSMQVVVPMAGLGTRLLPITKATPKSMVPLLDRPALHHVVDEAVQSGLTDFCFIVNEDEQSTIEHYFSRDVALDAVLSEKHKAEFIAPLNDVLDVTEFTYVVQPEPLGLGHAVRMAESYVRPGDFFCVMLPDNIIESTDPLMARLIAISQEYDAAVIAVEEVPREKASAYAVITIKDFITDDIVEVADIVEKPQSRSNMTCLAQVGRYVFPYDLFASLYSIKPGFAGEIQLTDAVADMLRKGKRVLAYHFQGNRYDTGTIPGLIKTTVALALHSPLYRDMVYNVVKKELSLF